MIDFQEKAPSFRLVCIFLFILVTLFYFRGCGVRLYYDDFDFSAFYSGEYSIYGSQLGDPSNISVVRPLQSLYYYLAYKVAGHQQFHIVLHTISRIMHLLVSICVFLLLKRLTNNTLIGISSAILFAGFYLHSRPVQTLFNSQDLMLCLFGLLSLIFYIRHFDGRGFYNYILALISLCLAFLSKESGVTLFTLILLTDIYLRKEAVERGGPWKNGISMQGINACLPFLLLSVLYISFLCLYCEATTNTNGTLHQVKTFYWLTSGEFFSFYQDFFHLAMLPVAIKHHVIKSTLAIFIIAVYITSKKEDRGFMQLLGLCILILTLPLALIHDFIHHWQHIYLPSIFTISLAACVIVQGTERLSGLPVVQSLFIETPKRKLLATLTACWLIILLGFVDYTLDIYRLLYEYIGNMLWLPVEPSAIYGYILFLLPPALLGLVIVYIRASKDIRGFIHLAGLCILILLLPVFIYSHAFSPAGKIFYLTAVIPMALLATTVGHLVERQLSLQVIDFHNPRAVCFALLFLIHLSIVLSNYNFVQEMIQVNINRQRVKDWVAEPVRGFLLQEEGYRGKSVYLLNFPPAVHTFLEYEYSPFEEILTDYKRAMAYSCGLELDAFDNVDVKVLPGKFVQYKIPLGKSNSIYFPIQELQLPTMSAEEFNELARNPQNKMLLLDQATEQILDVSGMDFDSVQKLMSDKEKQRTFVLHRKTPSNE